MSNRPLSENPEAVRKREYREKKRRERAAQASALPSAPVQSADAPPPLALPAGPPVTAETPRLASTEVVQEPRVSVGGPASSVPLASTEVVQGPGADAFAGPTLLDLGVELGGTSEDGYTDASEDGQADVQTSPRLVDPKPDASKEDEPQTAEGAAIIAKLVGLYVGFGWGLMAARHEDKLGPLAEQVAEMVARAKPELRELLAKYDERQKFQLGLSAMVGVVEDAALKMCVERNIKIPWQNELIVAGGVGSATYGIATEFGLIGGKKPDAPTFAEAPPAPPPPRSAPSWSSTEEKASAATEAEIVDGPPPAARRAVESNW